MKDQIEAQLFPFPWQQSEYYCPYLLPCNLFTAEIITEMNVHISYKDVTSVYVKKKEVGKSFLRFSKSSAVIRESDLSFLLP